MNLHLIKGNTRFLGGRAVSYARLSKDMRTFVSVSSPAFDLAERFSSSPFLACYGCTTFSEVIAQRTESSNSTFSFCKGKRLIVDQYRFGNVFVTMLPSVPESKYREYGVDVLFAGAFSTPGACLEAVLQHIDDYFSQYLLQITQRPELISEPSTIKHISSVPPLFIEQYIIKYFLDPLLLSHERGDSFEFERTYESFSSFCKGSSISPDVTTLRKVVERSPHFLQEEDLIWLLLSKMGAVLREEFELAGIYNARFTQLSS